MRRFRPSLPATLGTLALAGFFAAAGVWQLARAAEKRALLAGFEAGAASEPAALAPDTTVTTATRYQRHQISGRYDTAHQVLLDARTRAGQVGYEVLTPLLGPAPAVLVNRGWIPAGSDRTRLPPLEAGNDARIVTGLLDRLPRAAIASERPAPDPAAPWPRRMLYPTAAEIGAALGYPVADYQLLLDPAGPDGFVRDWRPPLMTPVQHVGYALQWFALAAAVVVLYVVLNLRRVPPEPSVPR
jgi:surfeit locus 1 family protein